MASRGQLRMGPRRRLEAVGPMLAIAEGLLARMPAAAEDNGFLGLEGVAFGVSNGERARDDAGAIVTNSDGSVGHGW